MNEKNKKDVEQITTAFSLLPEDKRSFLIGYAEGVIAANKRQEELEKTPA